MINLMEKQYYDHRTKLCGGCAYHCPEGIRHGQLGASNWKESCERYGYTFHPERYPEDADDCDGYRTPAQRAIEEKRNRTARR